MNFLSSYRPQNLRQNHRYNPGNTGPLLILLSWKSEQNCTTIKSSRRLAKNAFNQNFRKVKFFVWLKSSGQSLKYSRQFYFHVTCTLWPSAG